MLGPVSRFWQPFLIALFLSVGLAAALLPGTPPAAAQSTVIYVDRSASGAANGLSWTDAYTSLQAALGNAVFGSQIWVAAGVYTPGTAESDSFRVTSGISLYGGFYPVDGVDAWEERDWNVYLTVLSGDIGGDDRVGTGSVLTTTDHISRTNSDHVLWLDGSTDPVTQTTVIDGFIVTGGQADGAFPDSLGGALFCDGRGGECSPLLTNLTFQANLAQERGGALYNAGFAGGNSSPILTNVIFFANRADDGGAMFNDGADPGGRSSPILTNVTFRENRANRWGGALFNDGISGGTSSPVLTNVTVFGNQAGSGGALFNDGTGGDSSPSINNAILWANSASNVGNQISNASATPTIAYSLIQGGWNGPGVVNVSSTVTDGGGNIDGDPRFADPAGGDLRLLPGSPATDAGNTKALPSGIATDLAGDARFYDDRGVADTGAGGPPVVDMGALERQVDSCGYFASAPILYVDDSATGINDGLNWKDAFTDLQSALWVARDCPGRQEIWTAGGVYTPGTARSRSFNIPAGVVLYGGFAGDESSRDQRDWVANPTVLSGDIGGDDITDARGVVTTTGHITGLNSLHVLYLDGTRRPITRSTTVDGFVVTAGQANGPSSSRNGGGLICNSDGTGAVCGPSLVNLVFSGNRAELFGGAHFNNGRLGGVSSPLISHVTYVGNSAYLGGALFNNGAQEGGISSPLLMDVTFSRNAGDLGGGALINNGLSGGISNPLLMDVVFEDNVGGFLGGGALWSDGDAGISSPTLINVTFRRNATVGSGGYGGGAMLSRTTPDGVSSPVLVNVAFYSNTTETQGGAMSHYASSDAVSSPVLTNVTLADNTAGSQGGALSNVAEANGTSSPLLTNTILWGNQAVTGSQIYNENASPVIRFSLVQGGDGGSSDGNAFSAGPGNMDADPRFVDPSTGGLGLQIDSPAVDAGLTAALPVTVTTDVAGNPRVVGGIVDLGAFELQSGDMALTKGVQPAVAQPGDAITFTLHFTATGPATGVTLQDPLPPAFLLSQVVSATSGLTVNPIGAAPNLAWSLGDLRTGSRGVITLTGRLAMDLVDGTLITNSAVISAGNDLNTANNSSSVKVQVQAPHLAIVKTADVATVEVGGNVTFTVAVTNSGSVSASGVTVTDSLTGTLAADLELAPGAGLIRSYTLRAGDTPGPLVNTATVTGSLTAPVSSVVTVTVTGPSSRPIYLPAIRR